VTAIVADAEAAAGDDGWSGRPRDDLAESPSLSSLYLAGSRCTRSIRPNVNVNGSAAGATPMDRGRWVALYLRACLRAHATFPTIDKL
jgi:hypothetical protein